MSPAPRSIAANLHQVSEEIHAACRAAGRDPLEVQLIAVSKMHPAKAILEARAAGQRVFAENKVQEFEAKAAKLAAMPHSDPIEVHLIGHLQSNKAARAAALFAAVDTLDSLRLARRLNQAAADLQRRLPVLLEVKLSPEETKSGLEPGGEEAALLLAALPGLGWLEVRGLMTVPPWSDDAEQARPYFRRLRELRGQWQREHPGLHLGALSMGMSGDFRVAIEEGSTEVRIGTAIFGRREYPGPRP